jgi:hypothetical protein
MEMLSRQMGIWSFRDRSGVEMKVWAEVDFETEHAKWRINTNT